MLPRISITEDSMQLNCNKFSNKISLRLRAQGAWQLFQNFFVLGQVKIRSQRVVFKRKFWCYFVPTKFSVEKPSRLPRQVKPVIQQNYLKETCCQK